MHREAFYDSNQEMKQERRIYRGAVTKIKDKEVGKINEEEASEEQMLWKGKERNAIVMRYEVIRMSWKITEDVEDNWDTTIRSNTTREGET